MWGARPAHPPHHRPRHQPQFPHQRLPADAGEHMGMGSRAHPWVLAARGDGVAWSQHLPVEEEYVPPIRLRVLDTQGFGFRPHVGQACVQDLARFRREPHGEEQLPQPRVPVSGSNPGTTLSHPPSPLPHLCPSMPSPWDPLLHPCPFPIPQISLFHLYPYHHPVPIPTPSLSVPFLSLLSSYPLPALALTPVPPCPIPVPSHPSLSHPCFIPVPSMPPPCPTSSPRCPIPVLLQDAHFVSPPHTAAAWGRIAQVSPPVSPKPVPTPNSPGCAMGSPCLLFPNVPPTPNRCCPRWPLRRGLQTRWAKELGATRGHQRHPASPCCPPGHGEGGGG